MASGELSLLSPSLLDSEHLCNLCSCKYEQPRVLSCLHTYCESCLEKLQRMGNDKSNSALICPDCGQETKLPNKGVSGLQLDYVMCNQLDISTVDNVQIVCTSCKAKEKAVARCSECSTFLCSNCVTAHKYMRCFENHKVVSFEEMKGANDGLTLHKSLTCSNHPDETMKYYCYTCQIPICNECMVMDHQQPDHHYERASDAEKKQREELQNLVAESKSKVKFCEEATTTLEACLSDLEMQRDNAKSHIQETFHSYKTVLEKRKEELLKELDELHSAQELHIMDTFHCVEKTIEKIEDACKFAERLLKHGNTIEILSLKEVVGSQLLYLINNTPKPDISVDIAFETSAAKFQEAIKTAFGWLKKPEISAKGDETTPPQQPSPIHSTSPFENDSFVLPSGVLSPATTVTSSLDMDLTNNMVAQYNIAQLAGMAESSVSGSSSSPTPTSPQPPPPQATITLSDLLIPATSPDAAAAAAAQLNAINNLSALAKLGSLSVNNSVIPPISGQQGYNPPPRSATVKLNTMQIRCKFGQLGPGKGQFSSPHGFCLGLEEEVIVADTNNHRIQVFDKMGEFKYHFGVPGKEEGQLWYPRKVAVIRSSGKYVICDRGNERSRMQIFTKTGHFTKKIAIRYIDIVAGLAITSEGHIVAVDSVSPTVFVISETGDLLRWFDCSEYMREPSDIAISGKEFYICDFKGHCVIVFTEEGQFLRRIGCENITNFPNGIDISDAGDILVGDSHGNRFHVVVFSRDGLILSEFECPYVKVSRCCGLKITSEGYVVTLAKNNHHVLILNTLYIM